MEKQYAVVSKARKQVLDFKDNNSVSGVSAVFNYIVDLSGHPQKDEVQLEWFYDETKNLFHEEGEIPYPDPTPELVVGPTQFDRIESKADYLLMMQE